MKLILIGLFLVGCGNQTRFYSDYTIIDLYDFYPNLQECHDSYMADEISFGKLKECISEATGGEITIEIGKKEYDQINGKPEKPKKKPKL